MQGQVEIADQVEALQALKASGLVEIDMARIAIHGWSYGTCANFSLLAVSSPEVFCFAVSHTPLMCLLLLAQADTYR